MKNLILMLVGVSIVGINSLLSFPTPMNHIIGFVGGFMIGWNFMAMILNKLD
jgi:hypothetical protein